MLVSNITETTLRLAQPLIELPFPVQFYHFQENVEKKESLGTTDSLTQMRKLSPRPISAHLQMSKRWICSLQFTGNPKSQYRGGGCLMSIIWCQLVASQRTMQTHLYSKIRLLLNIQILHAENVWSFLQILWVNYLTIRKLNTQTFSFCFIFCLIF